MMDPWANRRTCTRLKTYKELKTSLRVRRNDRNDQRKNSIRDRECLQKYDQTTYSNHDGIPMTSNLSYLLSWLVLFLGMEQGNENLISLTTFEQPLTQNGLQVLHVERQTKLALGFIFS